MAAGAPLEYSGADHIERVLHILEGRYGLQPGWCVLSVAEVEYNFSADDD